MVRGYAVSPDLNTQETGTDLRLIFEQDKPL